jgi:hypothetical protein
MIKAGEELADIRVEHPVHLLAFDTYRERIERMMRTTPWPETIGEPSKVRLVDSVEHLDDGTLENLVLHRGNTQRPLPPVRLRDVRTP